MIKASLGTVQLTKANYELCDLLKTTPQEIDFVVEAGLKNRPHLHIICTY